MNSRFRGFLTLIAPDGAYHVPTCFSQVVKFQGQGIGRPTLAYLHPLKLSKVPNVLHRGPNFSTGFELKAHILGRLHLSVHLRIAFLLVAMWYTSPHGNDGKVHARHTARVRAQLDGWPLSPLTPQSLTTPQPRHRSKNHDYYSARSHQFAQQTYASNG